MLEAKKTDVLCRHAFKTYQQGFTLVKLICEKDMGVSLYVLFQTIVICAYTSVTMSTNSGTITDKSHTTSGNGYKMSDESHKMSDNVYKMSYDSYKMAGDSYKTSSLEKSLNFLGLSPLYKLYNKCVGKEVSKSVQECLSTHVVILMDEMVHQKRIPLINGVQLVGREKSLGRSLSGEEHMLTADTLEASLPRNLETRQGILDSLILNKLFNIFETHRLEIELPNSRTIRGTCIQFSIHQRDLKIFKLWCCGLCRSKITYVTTRVS
jgi:hypothetical protein